MSEKEITEMISKTKNYFDKFNDYFKQTKLGLHLNS